MRRTRERVKGITTKVLKFQSTTKRVRPSKIPSSTRKQLILIELLLRRMWSKKYSTVLTKFLLMAITMMFNKKQFKLHS